MLSGIIIIILTKIISFEVVNKLKVKHPIIDVKFLKKLYYYHLLLSFVYYIYATFNPSDSKQYFQRIILDFRGLNWGDFYGVSTRFIEFTGYPFVKFMGFGYEGMMALFAWFGFMGFVYFYIFFKENIRFKHQVFGYDMLTIFFLLPNLHFWSGSFGKGAFIFLGIGLLFFGMNRLSERWIAILLGSLIIYHIRPHIMFMILVSVFIGTAFSTKGLGVVPKMVILAIAAVAFFYIYQDVLLLVGIEQGEELDQGMDLSRRASELSSATSGIDISGYSFPFLIFTFLFRPLFIDAPGILGFIVSVENVFYLLMFTKLLRVDVLKFLFKSDFKVKSAFLSFVSISVALAQISGNLGLAIRQKSQVMILFLFVIIKYLDEEKMIDYKKKWFAWRRRQISQKKQEELVP